MNWRLSLCVLISAVVLTLLLVSCDANLAKATCGWGSNVPANGDQVCSMSYRILDTLAHAEVSGNNAAIYRHVPAAGPASRIISFGRQLRHHRVTFLRVSPDPELSVLSADRIAVSLYLVGKDNQGQIGEYEGVTERINGTRITIVADDQTTGHW